MNIPYVFKKCSKCGEWKVANTVNFNKHKKGKYGLLSSCKKCKGKYMSQYHQQHKEQKNEYSRQYMKQYYQDNKEELKQKSKQYNQEHKVERRQYKKQYYQDNKVHLQEYQQQYNQEHREEKLQYMQQYNQGRKQYLHDYYSNYRNTEHGEIVLFNIYNRRRTKLENNGGELTVEQWKECMEFFGWKCAYSGKSVGTKKNRSIDHIIPVNAGGSGHPWNCVPMDKSLNISKSDKNMEEWYRQQDYFSEDRLQRIYDWMEYAYNKWSKQDEEGAI